MRIRYPLVLSLLLLLGAAAPAPSPEDVAGPPVVTMQPASPNPFGDATQIAVTARVDADLTVEAYNVLGQRVRVLFTGTIQSGQSVRLRFDGTGLPPGLYVVRAQAAGQVATQTVTLAS